MDFKSAMTEWVGLKAQLAAARKDLSVLNGREKDLRKFVTQTMKERSIDTVKVHDDKVKVNFKEMRLRSRGRSRPFWTLRPSSKLMV